MSILDDAIARFDTLKARVHDLIEPEKTVGEALENVVRHAVVEIHALGARLEELENRLIGGASTARLVEKTNEVLSQIPRPEVGENTGSGASPSAPAGDEASAGAASTPAAEGTADTDTEQSGA